MLLNNVKYIKVTKEQYDKVPEGKYESIINKFIENNEFFINSDLWNAYIAK